MQVVQQQITELTYSSIIDEYLDWDEDTEYALELTTLSNTSVCRYGNYYYRNVVTANKGNNPEENPTKWLQIESSNRTAMLDIRSQTKSKVTGGNIVVEFKRGNIDTLILGYYTANTITIEHLDLLGVPIAEVTQIVTHTVNNDVFDYFDYIYNPYTNETNRNIKLTVPYIGDKIRVTLSPLSGLTELGYLVAGEAISLGGTLYGVNFSFNSYTTREYNSIGVLNVKKSNVQDMVDFETVISSSSLVNLKRYIKRIYDDYVAFIVDESDTGVYENLITFGMIQDSSLVLENDVQSTISWSVIEAI